MAFIEKNDPVVINVKLTSKGRELLSRGKLTFKKIAIGDSEINYNFNNEHNFSPYYVNILRPKDKNPNILSFITRNVSGDTFNNIGDNIVSNTTVVTNTAKEFGFFDIGTSSTNFLTDLVHIKQSDAMVVLSGVTGGTKLNILKSPSYLANVNEPSVGDFIFIKWTTPDGNNTTGSTISINNLTPYLMYKIQEIVSGTLFNNNLIINVDRDLPNFNGSGGNVFAGIVIYPNIITITGITTSSDFVSDATLAFINNYESPQPEIPFWNLSIIFTDEIIGAKLTNKSYGTFRTNKYNGFVQYIQNLDPTIKKLGVIHYTNSSPENVYGEGFFNNTPILDIPYIMWHKSSGSTMGLTLRCGSEHTLDGLGTKYYDLVDEYDNILGKSFNYLKMFVIEDQELLYAMSYKSNRSWTLPSFNLGFNANLNIGCPVCSIITEIEYNGASSIGGNGDIYITNVTNTFGDILIEVKSQSSLGVTKTLNVAASIITTSLPIHITVPAGTYNIKIYDLGAIGGSGEACFDQHNNIIITESTSTLEIYDVEPTE